MLAEAADAAARTCVGSCGEESCWVNSLGQVCSRVFGKVSSPCSCSLHARPSSGIVPAGSDAPLLPFSSGVPGGVWGSALPCWGLHFALAFEVPCYVVCSVFEALRPLLVFFLLPFFWHLPRKPLLVCFLSCSFLPFQLLCWKRCCSLSNWFILG